MKINLHSGNVFREGFFFLSVYFKNTTVSYILFCRSYTQFPRSLYAGSLVHVECKIKNQKTEIAAFFSKTISTIIHTERLIGRINGITSVLLNSARFSYTRNTIMWWQDDVTDGHDTIVVHVLDLSFTRSKINSRRKSNTATRRISVFRWCARTYCCVDYSMRVDVCRILSSLVHCAFFTLGRREFPLGIRRAERFLVSIFFFFNRYCVRTLFRVRLGRTKSVAKRTAGPCNNNNNNHHRVEEFAPPAAPADTREKRFFSSSSSPSKCFPNITARCVRCLCINGKKKKFARNAKTENNAYDKNENKPGTFCVSVWFIFFTGVFFFFFCFLLFPCRGKKTITNVTTYII